MAKASGSGKATFVPSLGNNRVQDAHVRDETEQPEETSKGVWWGGGGG